MSKKECGWPNVKSLNGRVHCPVVNQQVVVQRGMCIKPKCLNCGKKNNGGNNGN